MKKSVKILISIVLVLALGAAGVFGYLYFSKDKSQNNPQEDTTNANNPVNTETVEFDRGNNVAEINGISVIADETGVRIFNETDKTEKKIFDKPARSVVFDGKMAYFAEMEIEDPTVELYDFEGEPVEKDEYNVWLRAKIYSYNVETDEIKEIVTTTRSHFTAIVYADETAVYYTDWSADKLGCTYIETPTCPLYKYDFEEQKSVLVMDKILPDTCEVRGDRLFYHKDGSVNGDDGYHVLYAFDFKSGESDKISEDEAQFLKLEGEKVYYIERKWGTESSDEIKYKLMSNDLRGQKAEVTAELDFLPDETRVFATYVNENILAFTGRFDGVYTYNIKDGTFEHNGDGTADYEVISNGTSAVLQKEYYSTEEEFIKTELYRYDGTAEQELIEESDEGSYATKITENGVYVHYYEGSDYCGIKFIPLEIK